MEPLRRLGVALGYSFAAWVTGALVVYAASSRLRRPWSVAAHCAGLVVTFGPVFSLYFRRARPLPPGAAAAVAVALPFLIDLALLSPHFARPFDPFLSFWDWQLPAGVTALTVTLAGRSRTAQKTLTTPS